MYALSVQNIPEGKEWLYEVKFDGYRCLAGRDKSGVTLWSRRGNDFTSQFPLIARACEALPGGTLLDGEIVAIANGSLLCAGEGAKWVRASTGRSCREANRIGNPRPAPSSTYLNASAPNGR